MIVFLPVGLHNRCISTSMWCPLRYNKAGATEHLSEFLRFLKVPQPSRTFTSVNSPDTVWLPGGASLSEMDATAQENRRQGESDPRLTPALFIKILSGDKDQEWLQWRDKRSEWWGERGRNALITCSKGDVAGWERKKPGWDLRLTGHCQGSNSLRDHLCTSCI